MKNAAHIYIYDTILAGMVWQEDDGYYFRYDTSYLDSEKPVPISLTLPLQKEIYHSKVLLPFFDGLIPEGWLLNIVEKNWKLNSNDRMELLLTACRDCVGAISVIPLEEETEGAS